MQEKRLSARAVATMSKPGRHADGGNLYLSVSNRDGYARRSWLYMFTWQGKLKAMGLGPYPLVSLAEARELRDKWRKALRDRRNPIEERRSGKTDARRQTFGECATDLISSKSSEWRNDRHRAQWSSTLHDYCEPIRDLPVDTIDTAAVLSVLQPIWGRIPETASRLRGRIEAVLDFAKAHKLRSGENPAAWRGHLALILPKRQKLSRGHHAAMNYADLPGFTDNLRRHQVNSVTALALEFLILTVARSGEVLGARWAEIDLSTSTWTIPADRMKAGRIHRVPLPDRAIEILEKLSPIRTNEFVFPGNRRGRPLSSASIGMLLRQMKASHVTAHGFRSSFRDWCAEIAHAPREIAEACLAHSSGSAVELAYLRSDVLERRRGLMSAWSAHCESRQAENVVAINAKGRA